jgi:hypothetical protein
MRIVTGLLCLSLLGCGDQVPQSATETARAEDRIECALAGSQTFAPDCAVEQVSGSLTIRHPDGGFRRLLVADDGSGVIAADGAAPASVQVIGGRRIEVTVDGDRYRLPATVKGQ